MNILADENLDAPVVTWLRQQGHDVLSMAETAPGKNDAEVLRLASTEQRVVVTFDRDFGNLVVGQDIRAPGVILLRLRTGSATELLRVFRAHWPTVAPRAIGSFIVVSRHKVRIRPLSPE
jgi:predicted nuclease of predicted toxin-antitoxin system